MAVNIDNHSFVSLRLEKDSTYLPGLLCRKSPYCFSRTCVALSNQQIGWAGHVVLEPG